jgi:hypothetical protein
MDGIRVAALLGCGSSKEAIMTWRALVAFVLLGAVASPAWAIAPPETRWTSTHDGNRIATTPVNDSAAAPDRVVGRVLAIDPQHGSFLLGTEAGMIALRANPEDLAGLQVGQTLEVEIVDEESPDDESPKEPASTWR